MINIRKKERQKLRWRYLRAASLANTTPESFVRQVKHSRDSWGPDWSALNRNIDAQVALAEFLDDYMRPEAVATLYTPDRLSIAEFRRRVERWRIRCARLHARASLPPRRQRKFEYILALEFGLHPRGGNTRRLHAHVLLYNLRDVPLDLLASEWRDLNDMENPEEPLIISYAPGPEGITYCLKTLGTDVDLISFSRKLSLEMAAESTL
jgi:hypothetical protein